MGLETEIRELGFPRPNSVPNGSTMSSFQIQILRGLDDLLAHADQWNDLWNRSETYQPTVTAELIDSWCRSFASESPFQAVVVQSGGEFVGALPLVSRRKWGIFPSFEFPTNCWSNSGDLMLDASFDRDEICRALITGLEQLDHYFVMFDDINLDSQRWASFLRALEDKKKEYRVSTSYTVGITDILHNWKLYEQSWSSNHRRALKKSRRKLEAAGEVRSERICENSGEFAAILRRCFEIEDRGWKGDSGGSVLGTPGMWDFMLQEATLVAQRGWLDLWLLKLDERIIAFNYCHYAKGTCFAHKISFDPDFRNFGPGRLLRLYQLEGMHQDPDARVFDSLGVMCQANASWSTTKYTMGKLWAATGSRFSGQLLKAVKTTQPLVNRIRGGPALPVEALEVGASRYLEFAEDKEQSLADPVGQRRS